MIRVKPLVYDCSKMPLLDPKSCLSLLWVSPSSGSLPPGPKALPAPPLHASFSYTWQQTAGGEACDPCSRTFHGVP